MSTNNNYLNKEIKPQFLNENAEKCKFKKFLGSKLQALISNQLSLCTAVTLSDRGIEKIEDFEGLGENLRRLDISKNSLNRLTSLQKLTNLSLLNVSSNLLKGDASLEELRYLGELRTLNISENDQIKHIRSHVVKPLQKLQALIASNCGFERVTFLRFLLNINCLVLSKNLLNEISLKELGNFDQLKKISLSFNRLSSFPDFSNCPQLQEIRINNNCISQISNSILQNKKLKLLDISSNLITNWADVEILSKLENLTNFSLKGNPLPAPPESVESTTIREDIAADEDRCSMTERLYRRYILSMFQHNIGKLSKPHVQLVVLDMKRVKVKWSHNKSESVALPNSNSQDKKVVSRLKEEPAPAASEAERDFDIGEEDETFWKPKSKKSQTATNVEASVCVLESGTVAVQAESPPPLLERATAAKLAATVSTKRKLPVDNSSSGGREKERKVISTLSLPPLPDVLGAGGPSAW